jgi:hypothetical protein
MIADSILGWVGLLLVDQRRANFPKRIERCKSFMELELKNDRTIEADLL